MPSQTPETVRIKGLVRKEWREGAAAWRKWSTQLSIQTREATTAIVEAAQIKPGMRVLDVASGSGEPALTIAEAVGPKGQVVATDLVPEMLAVARENAQRLGLSNISFQPADAEELPFRDATFDVVTCRFGITFWPNTQHALREIRRVLKPRGRTALTAFGPYEENPIFTTSIGIFTKYIQLPPDPDAPNIFKFAQAGSLSAALREAGFRQVHEEYRTVRWAFPGTVEENWQQRLEGGAPTFRRIWESIGPERWEHVVQEVVAAMRPYYDGQRVDFPALIVLATAIR